jgi:hypothetical protein
MGVYDYEVPDFVNVDVDAILKDFRSKPITPYVPHPEPVAEESEFTKGMKRGMEGLKSAGYGAAGLVGSGLGIDSVRDWGYQGFLEHEEEASKHAGRVQNIEDIKSIGDVGDWAAGTFGSLVPSIGEAAVTSAAGAIAGSAIGPEGTIAGGITGLVGKQAAKSMVRKLARTYVKDGMERQVAKAAAKEAVESLPAKALMRNLGTKAGIVAGTAPVEAGGMWGEGMQQGKDNPYSAAVFGTLSGLSELVGGEAELIDIFTNPARQAVKGNIVKRIGVELSKTIPQEAAQEATQETLAIINRKVVDPSYEMFGDDARSRVLNSAAAGALGGVAFGGVGGVMSGRSEGRGAGNEEETPSPQPPATEVDPWKEAEEPPHPVTAAEAEEQPVMLEVPKGPLTRAVETGTGTVPNIGETIPSITPTQTTDELVLDEARDWAKQMVGSGRTDLMRQHGEPSRVYDQRILESYQKKDERSTSSSPKYANVVLVNPETGAQETVKPEEVADRLKSGWRTPNQEESPVTHHSSPVTDLHSVTDADRNMLRMAQLRADYWERGSLDNGRSNKTQLFPWLNSWGKITPAEVGKAIGNFLEGRKLGDVQQRLVEAALEYERENPVPFAEEQKTTKEESQDEKVQEEVRGQGPGEIAPAATNALRERAQRYAEKAGYGDVSDWSDKEVASFVKTYDAWRFAERQKQHLTQKISRTKEPKALERLQKTLGQVRKRQAELGLKGAARGEETGNQGTAGKASAGAETVPPVQKLDGQESDGMPVVQPADEVKAVPPITHHPSLITDTENKGGMQDDLSEVRQEERGTEGEVPAVRGETVGNEQRKAKFAEARRKHILRKLAEAKEPKERERLQKALARLEAERDSKQGKTEEKAEVGKLGKDIRKQRVEEFKKKYGYTEADNGEKQDSRKAPETRQEKLLDTLEKAYETQTKRLNSMNLPVPSKNDVRQYIQDGKGAVADVTASIQDIMEEMSRASVQESDSSIPSTTPATEEERPAGAAPPASDEMSKAPSMVRDFAAKVLNGENHPKRLVFKVTTETKRQKVINDTGVDIGGSVEMVLPDSIIHVKKRHLDITLDDWERLPEIAETFNDSYIGRAIGDPKTKRMIFVRESDPYQYVYVAEFASGGRGKRLIVKTYFKDTSKNIEDFLEKNAQKTKEASSGVGDLTQPALRPQNSTSSVDIVPNSDGNVKENEGKIDDFGEKIGGARKDTAEKVSSQTRKAKDKETAPAWKKRFIVSESVKTPGQFKIIDTREGRYSFSSGGQPFTSKEEAENALPVYAVAKTHHVYQNADKTWSVWKRVGERKRLKVVDRDFQSREDAMRFMAKNAVSLLENKTSFGEEILPVPEIAVRKGEERRTGPATPEMFMETFTPRGIEFGNWTNQEERQQVMDHAYDGLLDLAEVLGVPPKALMLNGELAIAFGARGQGLSGAKAHYERDYGVINLTKMKGAGSLAHEWFHALDHYLGRLDGKATSEKEQNKRGDQVYKTRGTGDYLSHGASYKSQLRQELREAYTALVKTMYKKAEQYVEDTEKTEKFVGAARENLKETLDRIRTDLSRDLSNEYTWRKSKKGLAPASAEQLAEFDRLASILVEGGDLATSFRQDNPTAPANSRAAFSGRNTNESLEGISRILKAVRNRSGFNAERTGTLDRLRADMNLYDQRLKMLQEAESGTEKTKQVPTSFAMEAKKMDQARSGDYWSEPHEMAARAFAAYVEDKVAERGGQSDFLVYHAHGGIVVPMIDGFVARPYPEGKERQALNTAFDKFVKAIRTEETEKGVVMFALAPNPGAPFYSKLEKVVESKFPGKSDTRMAAQMLQAWQKKGEFTSDELGQSGLKDFLAGETKVTKQDVLDFLKEQQTEFQDVVLGEESKEQLYEGPDSWGDMPAMTLESWKNEIPENEQEAKATHWYDWYRDDAYRAEDMGEDLSWSDYRDGLIDDLKKSQEIEQPTHFSRYTEPGAKEGSYREMFVTVPSQKPVSVQGEYRLKSIGDGRWELTKGGQFVGEYPSKAEAESRMAKGSEKTFGWQDGHSQYSDIKNPVVRIRFNERENSGKRILFVEEMQGPSDTEQKKMPEWLRKRIYDIGVKRILAYAKENGFDGVAWTTGEMQAARYDLSKQISRIKYEKSSTGVSNEVNEEYVKDGVLLAYDLDGKQVIKEYISDGELPNYIGKDAAEKLMKLNPEPGRTLGGLGGISRELSGLDLKVGGEGLKRLYDQTIPAMFAKYGKETVGKVTYFHSGQKQFGEGNALTAAEQEEYDILEELESNDRPMTQAQLDRFGELDDRLAAINYERPEMKPGAITVPFIPITEKTASVYPLYSAATSRASSGLPAADIRASFEPVYKNMPKAPPWRVVQTAAELPKRALDDAARRGIPQRFLQAVYLGHEVVYVADHFNSIEEAKQVILEEVVVHHGLRGIMARDTYEKHMLQAALWYANKRTDEWKALGKTYGLDLKSRAGRIEAAEEMLGRDARTGTDSTLMTRIIAAVKEFLRSIGFDLGYGESEIRELLGKARRFVEGKETPRLEKKGKGGIDYGALLRNLRERGITDEQLQAVAAFEPGGANYAVAEQSRNRMVEVLDAVKKIAAGSDEETLKDFRGDLETLGGTNDVTLVWGDSKKGLRHIGEKRGAQVVADVLTAVAHGSIAKQVAGKKTVHIVLGNTEAVLSLDEHGKRKSWLLTGWRIGESDAFGGVGAHADATQAGPVFSRSDLGADSVKQIIANMENIEKLLSATKFALSRLQDVKTQITDKGVSLNTAEREVLEADRAKAVEAIGETVKDYDEPGRFLFRAIYESDQDKAPGVVPYNPERGHYAAGENLKGSWWTTSLSTAQEIAWSKARGGKKVKIVALPLDRLPNGNIYIQNTNPPGMVYDLFVGLPADVPMSAVREMPIDSGIRYALADRFAGYVGEMQGGAIWKKIARLLNPLDWSHVYGWFKNITPQNIQNGLARVFRDPIGAAEVDEDKKIFVERGIQRERNKTSLVLRLFGWFGPREKIPNFFERLTKTFTTFHNNDLTTAWGRIVDEFGKLSQGDRKGVDWLLYRGDVDGKVYRTYDMVKNDRKVSKKLPSEAAFNTYLKVRTHIDTTVADTIEDITRQFMAENGMSGDEIEKHIFNYRQGLARHVGWLPRNHGEGNWQVNIYQRITGLKWDIGQYQAVKHVKYLTKNGKTVEFERTIDALSAYLPYFPSHDVAKEIKTLAKRFGLAYEQENGRQRVYVDKGAQKRFGKAVEKLKASLAGEGLDQAKREEMQKKLEELETALTFIKDHSPSRQIQFFVKQASKIIGRLESKNLMSIHRAKENLKQAIEDKESATEIRRLEDELEKLGDGSIKVKVYMRLQSSRSKADKHMKAVRADLRKAIPENFRESGIYEVKVKFNDRISESTYGDMQNDFAMEQAQLQAISMASSKQEITKEEAAAIRHQIIQSTAEVLMARGAGAHRIQRAEYLIEGYDTENTLDAYQDYMTGTAGMLSKAKYAHDQFENFRYAKPEVKAWAEQYIKDTLRNMGYGDMVSGNLRSLASLAYLGFKVSSMVINATQPWTLGVAHLGMLTKRSPLKAIAKAQRDILSCKTAKKEGDIGITKSEAEIFASEIWKEQEQKTAVHEMAGSSEGATGKVSRFMHTLTDKALFGFQEVEMLNRKTVILAAYRTFKADGMEHGEALKKALDVNGQVNNEMSRANKPGIAQNPVGNTLFTLQSFTWRTWNWVFNRLTSGKKEDMIALLRYAAAMAIIGGVAALPGGDELDKLYQMLFGESPKLAFQKWTKKHAREYGSLGEMVNGFAWHGLASATGVNISNAMRLQIPIVSPVLSGDSLPEAAGGVFTGLAQKGARAVTAASRGDMYRMIENISPEALSGGMRAYRMATRGATTGTGKVIFDESGRPMKYGAGEAVTRALGFQPSRVSERNDLTNVEKGLSVHWKEERGDLLAELRLAKPGERKEVTLKIMRFNRRLRDSQAAGLVPVIKAETIRRTLAEKPNKRKAEWEQNQLTT